MKEKHQTKPLKTAVIGMGGIGNTHARCHRENTLSQLVAVCDVVREKAEKAAETHGVKAYTGLTELLAHEEVDIIDVTTSGYENGSWHYEPVMEALAAGKDVLCEKPLSNDIGETREMVESARTRKLRLGCNLNHYFTPTAERARQYMAEGRVGEVISVLFRMGFQGGEASYGFNPSPRFNRPYAHLKAFLTHPLSVMRYFCGDVTHVQAFLSRTGYRKNKGDLLLSVNSVHLLFENGAIGYLMSHRGDAVWGLGGWWSCEIAGSRGTFCIENCIEKLTYWPAPDPDTKYGLGEAPPPEVTDTGIKSFGETFPRRIHAFLEDTANGVSPDTIRASGRDALATLEVIEAVIQSHENGGMLTRPHPLPPLHGDPLTEII